MNIVLYALGQKKVNHQIKFIIEILIIILGKKILMKIVYLPKNNL